MIVLIVILGTLYAAGVAGTFLVFYAAEYSLRNPTGKTQNRPSTRAQLHILGGAFLWPVLVVVDYFG